MNRAPTWFSTLGIELELTLIMLMFQRRRVGTPLCPCEFNTAWADKIPAHPTLHWSRHIRSLSHLWERERMCLELSKRGKQQR